MGWFDNHVRDCASICDAARVTGYGSVQLYCPPHVEMDNTEIERNLLIPRSEVALPFTPRADGLVFDVRKERGTHDFLIDRVDVFAAEELRSPAAYRFTAHRFCSGNAYTEERDETVPENGRRMCCVDLDSARRTACSASPV